jgi:NADH:ubiquinone oxidoreductase subunit 4 (subunit M)
MQARILILPHSWGVSLEGVSSPMVLLVSLLMALSVGSLQPADIIADGPGMVSPHALVLEAGNPRSKPTDIVGSGPGM